MLKIADYYLDKTDTTRIVMRFSILYYLLLLFPGAAAAESLFDIYKNTTKSEKSTILIDIENDALTNSDRFYTNGIRLSQAFNSTTYISVNGKKAAFVNGDGEIKPIGNPLPMESKVPPPEGCEDKPQTAYELHFRANVLNCFTGENDFKVFKHNAGQHFANLIYTPTEITARFDEFEPLDRPYAGYTYYSRFVETLYADDSSTRYELQLGLLGRASLSEEVQKNWHKLWDLDDPTWEKQIATEPAVQFNYTHRFAIPRFMQWNKDRILNTRYADVQPYVFIEAGTVFMRATAGLDVRVSLYNMKTYFDAPFLISKVPKMGDLDPLTPAPEPVRKPEPPSKHCFLKVICTPTSAYLFATAEETAVLRNSTIEGGMFTDSPYTQHATKRVRTTAIGIRVAWETWQLSAAFNARSPEVEGIPFDEDYHRWGELRFGFNW